MEERTAKQQERIDKLENMVEGKSDEEVSVEVRNMCLRLDLRNFCTLNNGGSPTLKLLV